MSQNQEKDKAPEKKEAVKLPKGITRLKIPGGSVSHDGNEYKPEDNSGTVIVPDAAVSELLQHGCTKV